MLCDVDDHVVYLYDLMSASPHILAGYLVTFDIMHDLLNS